MPAAASWNKLSSIPIWIGLQLSVYELGLASIAFPYNTHHPGQIPVRREGGVDDALVPSMIESAECFPSPPWGEGQGKGNLSDVPQEKNPSSAHLLVQNFRSAATPFFFWLLALRISSLLPELPPAFFFLGHCTRSFHRQGDLVVQQAQRIVCGDSLKVLLAN